MIIINYYCDIALIILTILPMNVKGFLHVRDKAETPNYFPFVTGHVEVVDLLLKHSSKGDHQTKTGCTPLMEATRLVFATLIRSGFSLVFSTAGKEPFQTGKAFG